MNILFKFGKELFWTIFWILLSLIVAWYVLGKLISFNIPLLSPFSSWVEEHAKG